MSLLLLFGGASGGGSADLTVNAELASATATAYDTAAGAMTLSAGNASATATANAPTLGVSITAQTAYAGASASDATAGQTVTGPADLRRTVLVDIYGTAVAMLGGALHGPLARTFGGEDAASFRLAASDPDVALIAGSTGTRYRKVQLWRGERLLIFGTIVDWTYGTDGWVTFTVAGPSADLAALHVGPIEPTNQLTNPSFELGFTGWSFAKTATGDTFTTYTQRDARDDVLPGEEVCIIAVGGVVGFDAKLALRLYGSTGTDGYGEVFAWQEFTVSGGVQGRRITLSGRVWLSSSIFVRYPLYNRGLMLARFASPLSSSGTNGGKTAWFTDMLEWRSSHIDETTPTDRWLEQSCTIDIAAGATEVIHVRLNSCAGLVYYDDLRLDFQDRLEVYQSTQASIVEQVVAHAQSTTYGKVDQNIKVIKTGQPGPLRDLVSVHADRAGIWDLCQQFTRYDDGVDIRSRYLPHGRYIEVGYPRLGYVRPDRPLWSGGAVVAVERMAGNDAANAITIRADNTEAPAWGSATSASVFADGQIREVIGSASIAARNNDLDNDATELLAASLDPVTARVSIHPDWLDEYLDLLPGDWCPVNIKDGNLSLIGTYRVVGSELDVNDWLHLDLGQRAAPT